MEALFPPIVDKHHDCQSPKCGKQNTIIKLQLHVGWACIIQSQHLQCRVLTYIFVVFFFPSTSDYLGKEAVMSMNSLTQTAVPGCNLQSAARSFSFNRDGWRQMICRSDCIMLSKVMLNELYWWTMREGGKRGLLKRDCWPYRLGVMMFTLVGLINIEYTEVRTFNLHS